MILQQSEFDKSSKPPFHCFYFLTNLRYTVRTCYLDIDLKETSDCQIEAPFT